MKYTPPQQATQVPKSLPPHGPSSVRPSLYLLRLVYMCGGAGRVWRDEGEDGRCARETYKGDENRREAHTQDGTQQKKENGHAIHMVFLLRSSLILKNLNTWLCFSFSDGGGTKYAFLCPLRSPVFFPSLHGMALLLLLLAFDLSEEEGPRGWGERTRRKSSLLCPTTGGGAVRTRLGNVKRKKYQKNRPHPVQNQVVFLNLILPIRKRIFLAR